MFLKRNKIRVAIVFTNFLFFVFLVTVSLFSIVSIVRADSDVCWCKKMPYNTSRECYAVQSSPANQAACDSGIIINGACGNGKAISWGVEHPYNVLITNDCQIQKNYCWCTKTNRDGCEMFLLEGQNDDNYCNTLCSNKGQTETHFDAIVRDYSDAPECISQCFVFPGKSEPSANYCRKKSEHGACIADANCDWRTCKGVDSKDDAVCAQRYSSCEIGSPACKFGHEKFDKLPPPKPEVKKIDDKKAETPKDDSAAMLAKLRAEAKTLNQIGGGTEYQTPQDLIGLFIKFLVIGLMGMITLVLIIYSGAKWMLAAGNAEQIESAKKTIIWVIIGVAVMLAGYMIVNLFVQLLNTGTF